MRSDIHGLTNYEEVSANAGFSPHSRNPAPRRNRGGALVSSRLSPVLPALAHLLLTPEDW